MKWRIWLYVFVMLVVISVVVDVWTEQAGGGFSSSDRILYSGVGLILVSPFIAFDFLRWAIGSSSGPWPAAALIASVLLAGLGAGLIVGHLLTGCIREAPDVMSCWAGHQVYFGLLVADISMVLVLLVGERALVPPPNPADDSS